MLAVKAFPLIVPLLAQLRLGLIYSSFFEEALRNLPVHRTGIGAYNSIPADIAGQCSGGNIRTSSHAMKIDFHKQDARTDTMTVRHVLAQRMLHETYNSEHINWNVPQAVAA